MQHITIDERRVWHTDRSACFGSPQGRFGALANFARSFPLTIAGVAVPTSESLYQALRFPDHPDVQRRIVGQPTPRAAKQLAHAHLADLGHRGWDTVRVAAMEWSLRAKHHQHQVAIEGALAATRTSEIVEVSSFDRFWGACPTADAMLVGANVLGQLWMLRRDRVVSTPLTTMPAAELRTLRFLGIPITDILV